MGKSGQISDNSECFIKQLNPKIGKSGLISDISQFRIFFTSAQPPNRENLACYLAI